MSLEDAPTRTVSEVQDEIFFAEGELSDLEGRLEELRDELYAAEDAETEEVE